MANNAGKMPGNMGGLMKAMSTAMRQTNEIEKELEKEVIEVNAGGGAINVTISGAGDISQIKINKDVVNPDDVQLLEDLVLTAVKEAVEKARALRKDRLGSIIPGGGFGLPNLF
jgi:DNA-binding YbaB/EbfC family protein